MNPPQKFSYEQNRNEGSSQFATKATLVYLFLSLLPTGIKFFLLPIYVKFLSPADYGVLSILNLFGSFYAVFSIFQLSTVATVDYFKVNDKVGFERNLLSISIILGLIIFIGFCLAGPFLFELFFSKINIAFYPSGLVVLVTYFLTAIHGLYFVFLRNKYSLKELSFYSILLVVTSSIFQFYFIVVKDLGYMGSLWGALIASGLISSIIIVRNYHLLTFRIKSEFIKNALRFSAPMIITILLAWLQRASDRIYLERFISIEKVGLYSILMTILGFALLLNSAYGMAIRPTLFKYLLNAEKNSHKLKEVINQFILLTILSISGVILLGSNLSLLTDQSKYLKIVPYFTLGALVILPKMLIKIPRLQLLFNGKTNEITLYTFISVVLMISLIPIFISYDIKGVIVAVSLAHLLEFTLYYNSFFRSKIPHNLKQAVFTLLVSMASILSAYQVKRVFNLSYETFGWLQFVFILLVLIIFGRKKIRPIVQMIKSRIA